ncbi:hypothetical protein CLV62_1404 [Dysgonomonas alginatilytica]|uniref:Uncharacterized protein n=1 Tax=Dysgonomonas alginatilytica TaxID=1605892 RepID=A0A2V3PIX1_9BACT|nr:hypothetical protein CLV62_1404 [Dysgonomonas alginatilytica]
MTDKHIHYTMMAPGNGELNDLKINGEGYTIKKVSKLLF